MMTAQEQETKERIEARFSELCAALAGEQGREVWNQLGETGLQDLLSILIKIYASKVKAGDSFNPVSTKELNGTESVIFADHLMQQMEIELFEVQIWRSLGSNY